MKKFMLFVSCLVMGLCMPVVASAALDESIELEHYVSDETIMDTVNGLMDHQIEPQYDGSVSFVDTFDGNVESVAMLNESENDAIYDVRYLATVEGQDLYQATYIARANLTRRDEQIYDGIHVYLAAVYTQLVRSDDSNVTYTRILNMKFGSLSSANGYVLKNISLGFTGFGMTCTSATSAITAGNLNDWSDSRDTLATGASLSRYNTNNKYFSETDITGTGACAKFSTSKNSTTREFIVYFGQGA